MRSPGYISINKEKSMDDLDWNNPAVQADLYEALRTVKASDLEGRLDELEPDARARIEPRVRAGCHNDDDRRTMAAMLKVIEDRRLTGIFDKVLAGILETSR